MLASFFDLALRFFLGALDAEFSFLREKGIFGSDEFTFGDEVDFTQL